MSDHNDVSAEEMYRRARRGWFYAFPGFIILIVVGHFFMQTLMSDPNRREPFVVADERTIIYVSSTLAAVIFIGSLIFKATFTRRGIDQQDRRLVLKGMLYGYQASAMVGVIGLVLAIVFWYPYFYVWIVLGMVSLLIHFPRLQPLLDASYKQF